MAKLTQAEQFQHLLKENVILQAHVFALQETLFELYKSRSFWVRKEFIDDIIRPKMEKRIPELIKETELLTEESKKELSKFVIS